MVRSLVLTLSLSVACAQGQGLPAPDFDDDDDTQEGGGGQGAAGQGGAGQGGQGGATSSASTASGANTSSNSNSTSSASASSSNSSSATTAATSTTTSTGGGADYGTVLMMSGGGTATVASVFPVGSNQSWASPFLVQTWDPTALVVTPASTAYGLMRADGDGSVFFVSWAGGTMWSADPTLLPGGPASSRPHAAADGEEVHVVFRGPSGEVIDTVLENGSILSTELIGAVTSGPPAVLVGSTGPVVVFIGDDGVARTRLKQSSGWVDGPALASDPLASRTPAIARDADGSFLAAFVRASDQAIVVAVLQGSAWSQPQVIPSAFTADDPQLAIGTSMGALAFRGLDHFGYVAQRSVDGAFQAVEPILTANPQLACAPSVAAGASGADLELVFVDTLALAHWTRFDAGSFGPPQFVGAAGPPSCVTVAVAP